MTLPDERYRALRYALRFMQDLLDPKKTPRVPRKIRQQACSVLRHFPHGYEIDQIARKCPGILGKVK